MAGVLSGQMFTITMVTARATRARAHSSLRWSAIESRMQVVLGIFGI